ncbi:MAG: Tm-1-like ATP-binding domain-containing protein [Planctomycetaceae bacterium]|nr:Tm-1-like ATP-binding domain-containing protein [Planctomycetaceae bacterium]
MSDRQNMTKYTYAVATMDTKRDELLFVVDLMRESGLAVRVVDVSTAVSSDTSVSKDADFRPFDILGDDLNDVHGLDRGSAVVRMTEGFSEFISRQYQSGQMSGIIGLGGSGGTAIVTAGMRRLPIGLPKVMLSTVASGNTAPYVDCNDICMMYSVVDVAGLNAVSRVVLANAANAVAGMVLHRPAHQMERKPTIGMTMFGVTTACVTRVRNALQERGFDCLVFHATGAGGRAMEKLVQSGLIDGVLDITTTEVADEIVGGVFPAGPTRFDAILESRIPYVISLGALDMVNFGARDTVPAEFRDRRLYVHNSQVTLMRTNIVENRRIAQWIANKLNSATSPFVVLIPERGVSALDIDGGPFADAEADQSLFDELEASIEPADGRRISRFPLHINDDGFADALVQAFMEVYEHRRTNGATMSLAE